MKYHSLFFQKFGKMLKKLSSAAVLIDALRVKDFWSYFSFYSKKNKIFCEQTVTS